MGFLDYGKRTHRRIDYAHTRAWHRGHVPYKCCKDAHVVITGGASGIGLELAKEAVARGARAVSIIDLSDCTRAHQLLKNCAADGLSIVFRTKIACFQADVSQYEQVAWQPHSLLSLAACPCQGVLKDVSWLLTQICEAITACKDANGPVDVIVANAGIGPCGEQTNPSLHAMRMGALPHRCCSCRKAGLRA